MPIIFVPAMCCDYTGKAEAICMPDVCFDGAECLDDLTTEESDKCADVTRGQVKNQGKVVPLKVTYGVKTTGTKKAELTRVLQEKKKLFLHSKDKASQ